jgi:hypothetical protein
MERTGSAALAIALCAVAACSSSSKTPPTPALTYDVDAATQVHRFYADGTLLAVYDHTSNTFTQFIVDGVNVIGGFSSADPDTNYGPSAAGHSADYPFGRLDAPGTSESKGRWEGFWSGFGFVNKATGFWEGVNGNPGAVKSLDVTPTAGGLLDLHAVSEVTSSADPVNPEFRCDVHYLVSTKGIGVSSTTTFLKTLETWGYDDTGGQLLMTQADIDLDPTPPSDPGYPYPYSREKAGQPSLYWKLAYDEGTQDIDSFPPYSQWTPSNIYSETESAPGTDPSVATHGLPNTARVSTTQPFTFLSPLDRPDRELNLALRVDLVRSTLPPLEYYCEVNGERDYFNYLYSASVGENRGTSIASGTVWHVYGDLLPWRGSDPEVLRSIPLLSDVAP